MNAKHAERYLILDPDATEFIYAARGTAAQLSRDLGKSEQLIHGWLKGKNAIKESDLAELAAAVKVAPAALLSDASRNFIKILPRSDGWK